MVVLADIIAFLLDLLSDDAARAEFDQDPRGALDRAGLEGVTAQDVRDARLQLADAGAVHRTDDPDDPDPPYRGDDPVHEIGHTARHYAADEGVHHQPVDQATLITIDDRDTLFFQSISDDDVTVTDNSVTVADSFNVDASDDDLVAIQDNDTTVSDDDVTIQDSFDQDNDQVAIQDNDVNGGDGTLDVDVNAPAAADPEPDADLEPDAGDGADTDAQADADIEAEADAVTPVG